MSEEAPSDRRIPGSAHSKKGSAFLLKGKSIVDRGHSKKTVDRTQTISKQVFWQSIHYVISFYLTYTFPTILRFMQTIDKEVSYALFVLFGLTIPLQGFWNATVHFASIYRGNKSGANNSKRNSRLPRTNINDPSKTRYDMGSSSALGINDKTRDDGTSRKDESVKINEIAAYENEPVKGEEVVKEKVFLDDNHVEDVHAVDQDQSTESTDDQAKE